MNQIQFTIKNPTASQIPELYVPDADGYEATNVYWYYAGDDAVMVVNAQKEMK